MAAGQLPSGRSAAAADSRRRAARLLRAPAQAGCAAAGRACRASTALPGPTSRTPTACSTPNCSPPSSTPTRKSTNSRWANSGRCPRPCAWCCWRTCGASPRASPPSKVAREVAHAVVGRGRHAVGAGARRSSPRRCRAAACSDAYLHATVAAAARSSAAKHSRALVRWTERHCPNGPAPDQRGPDRRRPPPT